METNTLGSLALAIATALAIASCSGEESAPTEPPDFSEGEYLEASTEVFCEFGEGSKASTISPCEWGFIMGGTWTQRVWREQGEKPTSDDVEATMTEVQDLLVHRGDLTRREALSQRFEIGYYGGWYYVIHGEWQRPSPS